MTTPNGQPGEDTAAHGPENKACRNGCGNTVPPPKRRGLIKEFCSDRCRAAFREKQIQAALREAVEAVDEAAGELARLSARLDGAKLLLARYQAKTTRPRKPRQPAASPVLTKALGVLLKNDVG